MPPVPGLRVRVFRCLVHGASSGRFAYWRRSWACVGGGGNGRIYCIQRVALNETLSNY
jgi:hypothetical protein